MNMKTLMTSCAAALLLSLTVLAATSAHAVHTAGQAAAVALHRHADSLIAITEDVHAVRVEMTGDARRAGLLPDLREELRAARQMVDRRSGQALDQTSTFLVRADQQIGELQRRTDQQLRDIRGDLNRKLDPLAAQGTVVLASYAAIPEKVQALLTPAHSILTDAQAVSNRHLQCTDPATGRGRGDCWPSRLTGILGGTNVLLGEAAQTMRTIDHRMPELTDAGVGIAQDVKKATGFYVSRKRMAIEGGFRLAGLLW